MSLNRATKQCYSFAQRARNDKQESTSFSVANSLWIQKVTGVNMENQKWTNYVIDKTIHPGPKFKTAFENVGKAFHQLFEGGRRIYLNLFLSNIILCPEFEGALRIFPELELTAVQTNGTMKSKLTGKADYTVGLARGIDMFDPVSPCKVHQVAVEAKVSIKKAEKHQCISEVASLHQNQVDAGKVNTKVWGILLNATDWRFFFINENHFLWQSDEIFLEPTLT